MSWSPWGASYTAEPWVISASTAPWTRPSQSARWSFAAILTVTRRGAVSSPTVPRRRNMKSCSRRARCCVGRSSLRRRASKVPPSVLLIDNYDSFTYNLVQAFLILGAEVDVHRNDAIGVEQAL